MRIALNGLLTLLLAFNALAATKPHTTVDLLLPVETARPGDTILAGIRLRMEPKWHTYWKNPGDAGGPTEIQWQLPQGITAGDILWPAPDRYTVEGLTTFVYHDEVTLLVPLKLGRELAPGQLTVAAKVSWLECEQLCLPGSSLVSARFSVGSEPVPSAAAPLINSAQAALPQSDIGLGLKAAWEGPATGTTRNLLFEWPAVAGVTAPDFYPLPGKEFEVQPAPERLPVDSSRVAMRVKVTSADAHWPQEVKGMIVQTVNGQRQAYDVTLTPAAGQSSRVSTRDAGSFPDFGILLLQLLAALVGGMILNLMPCVLPILSLKILALVNQRGQEAAIARRHSLVYMLGVVVSFWAVAALVIAGRLTSYGGQFQDGRFVVIITALMTLIALNLFGVFEFVLPGKALNSANTLASSGGNRGAFFNGVLAVVLGASCVGPVMATAVGWAFTQPPAVIALVFTALGLGLALPFVTMTYIPALQRFLPRPGAWMDRFKTALGFPMLGMAAWAFSFIVAHHGRRGILWVGLFLVTLGLAAWVYGEFIQRSSKRSGLAWLAVAALLAGGYGYALEYQLDWRHPNESGIPGSHGTGRKTGEISWQNWSPEAVAKARAEGRPVLVDFTADWCLICQANMLSSIDIKSVREKLKAINAVALIGDYTLKQPEITAELARFERAGVPLVIVYPKDATKPPQVLPAVLTPDIVLNALETAAR